MSGYTRTTKFIDSSDASEYAARVAENFNKERHGNNGLKKVAENNGNIVSYRWTHPDADVGLTEEFVNSSLGGKPSITITQRYPSAAAVRQNFGSAD